MKTIYYLSLLAILIGLHLPDKGLSIIILTIGGLLFTFSFGKIFIKKLKNESN
jgi:hypothetical protein